jgi:hypothetical protein
MIVGLLSYNKSLSLPIKEQINFHEKIIINLFGFSVVGVFM